MRADPGAHQEPAVAVPADFGWITELGPAQLVTVVPELRRRVWVTLLAFGWAIVIGIGGLLGGVVLGSALRLPDPLSVVLAGVLWAISAGVVGFWLGSRAFRAAVVFEDGVAVRDAARVRCWRWDEVAEVIRSPSVERPEIPTDALQGAIVGILVGLHFLARKPLVRVVANYRFRDVYGGTFAIDRWLDDPWRIAARIDAEVTRLQLPVMERAYASGETLRFGLLSMSMGEGVQMGNGRRVAWPDVAALQLDKDTLRLRSADGRDLGSCPIDRVANLNILLALVRHAVRHVAAPPSPETAETG